MEREDEVDGLLASWHAVEGLPHIEEKLDVRSSSRSVGPYRLGSFLAAGSFGKIFHGFGTDQDQTHYAIKVIDKEKLIKRESIQRTLRRIRRVGMEVAAMRRLPPHPAIVRLVDCLHSEHDVCCVIEYGGDADLYVSENAPPTL